MTEPVQSPGRRNWRQFIERPAFLLGVVGVVCLALIAVPVFKDRRSPAQQNAVLNARVTYRTLAAQLSTPAALAAPPRTAAQDDSAETGRVRLKRDIFVASASGPVPDPKPDAPAKATRKVSPLDLSAVFIDGTAARAVIGGKVVAIGDAVVGYTVIEIHRDWVLLRKGDTEKRLKLGGT